MFKYYAFELITMDGSALKTPLLICKFWFFTNPVEALRGAKLKLNNDGLANHRIKAMRRIK